MEVIFEEMGLQTHKAEQAIDITPQISEKVKESGIQEGMVNVFTAHTSAGITVTEGLWDLEEDIFTYAKKLVSEDRGFRHNRYLDKDGRLAVNPSAHMKSVTFGYYASFPIHRGKIVKGSRQTIYFLEFDGPLYRYYNIQVLGE